MTVADWVGVGANVIMAVAAVVTTVVALLALRAWKIQLRGQSNYEVARRLLRSIRNVQHQIVWSSHWGLFTKQSSVAEGSNQHTAKLASSTLDELRRANDELQGAIVDAEILLGKQAVVEANKVLEGGRVAVFDIETYLSCVLGKGDYDESMLPELTRIMKQYQHRSVTGEHVASLDKITADMKPFL